MNWYKFNLSSFREDEYERCLRLMEKTRLERVDNITHEPTRRMSVFAEWKAKNLIAEELGKPVAEIFFCYSEKGKPLLEKGEIHFSISHSGEWAAVALDKQPVGIDVEVIRPVDPRLITRICTDDDLVFLKNGNQDENLALLKIWTAKEAYFKKTGTGIVGFKTVSYSALSPRHFFEDNLIITIV